MEAAAEMVVALAAEAGVVVTVAAWEEEVGVVTRAAAAVEAVSSRHSMAGI